MYQSKETQAKLRKVLELSERLPDETCFSMDETGIKCQGPTQNNVKTIRKLFHEVSVWKKVYEGGMCDWWEYHGETPDGFKIKIYACPTPPTCKMVTEEYTEKVMVPIAFEERMQTVPVAFEEQTVTKTRTRTVCPEGD